ncbi:MAG: 30S ribosomal protein S1 [Kiritimatiellae bacterium]|nr:30S ribosomal protein S1 [Kiritimatiellia bacterium]
MGPPSSTPTKQKPEKDKQMLASKTKKDPAKLKAMDEMLDESLGQAQENRIVKGMVLEVRPNEVLVDVGGKSEGIIPAGEFSDISLVKTGDELDVLVIQSENDEGMVVLSKKLADEKIKWEAVYQRYQEGSVVKGTIEAKVRGGMTVDVDGVKAFLPGSQIDVSPVHDPDPFVGQTFDFKLIKIVPERHNIIVSRRELLEEQLAVKRRELMETLKVGERRMGKVKNITDFGVFVDLDGIDGLLHITDLSWGRVRHPTDVVQQGQEIEVVVLDIDRERARISLGLKQAQPNPWDSIDTKYPVNSRLRGKVVNLVAYGAFVELEPGIEGLVHVSEFSWTRHIARASDMLKVGDEVDVVVLSVDKETQKIALGIRQTEENPWDSVAERYPVGTRVKGKVRNFTIYGAFVQLEDGIDGMIHVSDMSWTRKINHPQELLQKGQEVEAVVLEVDSENQRISLGLKQAQEDPWNTIASSFQVGQKVKGVVSKIASFGAFVELAGGVDGLVHISQISEERVERVKDALTIGQEVEARIVRIDRDERRIGLSLREANEGDSEDFKVPEEYLASESANALKAGQNIVGLASAFDQAFAAGGEEWSPDAEESK